MAFSLRKMLSNISYFTKGEGEDDYVLRPCNEPVEGNSLECMASELDFDRVEADSTSKCTSFYQPSVKNCDSKKGSLSDTDLLTGNNAAAKQDKKKCRKLKLDIDRANKSMNNSINTEDSSANLENTPKHKLLDCRSADYFKNFNFNQSFDISDESEESSNDIDIESLSDHSDTDISDDKYDIKMCRKVEHQSMPELLPSATPESFADVEVDKCEEQRINLLLNYQMKLEQVESLLKKLLHDFQFHIEVSKVFDCKATVPALPGNEVVKTLDLKYIDLQRGISPAWNIVTEKDTRSSKTEVKNQLSNMRQSIDEFIQSFLEERKPKQHSKVVHKPKLYKRKVTNKKKLKHFDYPDLREAMTLLFSTEKMQEIDDNDSPKCTCHCHNVDPETPKSDKGTPDHSITSSIGNFTMDSTTLSAYSESLDQIISFSSFETENLCNAMLQKAAIERISFYVQVHSIQLKCEPVDCESKNVMSFYCPTCKTTDYEENSVIKHILSQLHCEKLHFVYKTAYVKKCINDGKEIQPSTVLNPMKMYRDGNKIVCFGDAMYACSLCLENLIIGESVLMSHCADKEHIHRREMLADMFE